MEMISMLNVCSQGIIKECRISSGGTSYGSGGTSCKGIENTGTEGALSM